MISSSRAVTQSRIIKVDRSIPLLAIGFVILLLIESLLFPMTIDDAYISFRYSKNLANGHGVVWNVGEDPVEGYTNFLWVLIGALVAKLDLPLVVTMRLLSVGLSVVVLVLMYLISRMISPPRTFAAIPGLFLACMPAFALWAVAGLETILFIFLLLASLYIFLDEEFRDGWGRIIFGSPFFLLLLALTRPEGIVVFGSLAVARAVRWIRQSVPRAHLLRYIVWVTIFGSLWLMYFAWRWSYFGYPLPNTAYVKAHSGLVAIVGQIGVYLIPYGLRVFPFLMLGVYALGQSERLRAADLYLVIGLACLVVANLVSSDWMPGHRLALPMTPLILLLARQPLESILQGALRGHVWQRLAHTSVLLGLFFYALAPLLYTANLFNRVMATQMDMSIYRWSKEMQSIVDGQYVKVGQWLKDHAAPDSTVVAGNVGAIGYLSDLKVIDMIGLTDEHIARHGWTVEYLLGQRPDFIVLESDTRSGFGGLYGTSGEVFAATPAFANGYELVCVLDNGRTDEPTLFLHHLPHATWLFARKDLQLVSQIQVAGSE